MLLCGCKVTTKKVCNQKISLLVGVPASLLTRAHHILGRVVLRHPQLRVMQLLGHVLLVDKMAREVVGILVVLAISQLLHQLSGRVAQVQGHRGIARSGHKLLGRVDGHVGAVALGRGMGDDKKGRVIDCVQTGYKLNDKVIRHAKVAVGQ